MKVFVTGASGVLGRAAIAALRHDGHDVTGLVRSPAKAAMVETYGAQTVQVPLLEMDALAEAFAGFDVVCNVATHIPIGMAGLRRGAWKTNDRLRVEGSRVVVAAARQAGVRRIIQESVSFLYADGGDEVLTEDSPLAVTRAVEPSAVAESNVAGFDGASRTAVILRFGQFVGDDATTRWRLAQARAGRSIGTGSPEGWAHVVHPYDAGIAVAAALSAPAGVYNVGAEPVLRGDFTRVFGEAVGRPEIGFMPRLVVRIAGERLELTSRSQRVSSGLFHEVTGWKPVHDHFDRSWLPDVAA